MPTVTNCHNLGGLTQQNVFAHSFEGEKSKIAISLYGNQSFIRAVLYPKVLRKNSLIHPISEGCWHFL